MKHHKTRRKRSQPFVDPDFSRSLETDTSGYLSAGRQAARKEQQFCRQVQRALNLALADSAAGTGLADLFVEAVSPAPDCSRLLAYVVVPHGWPIAEALNALNRDAARLRTEVAMAIARKRAPELTFVPAVSEEAWNDINE